MSLSVDLLKFALLFSTPYAAFRVASPFLPELLSSACSRQRTVPSIGGKITTRGVARTPRQSVVRGAAVGSRPAALHIQQRPDSRPKLNQQG